MPAVLLPNGMQQFIDGNGAPYAAGTVDFYIPSTTTRKNTWQDPDKVTLNANPVVLDAAGRATIYGTGQYRQVLKDSLGNTIWDKLTADPFFGRSTIPFGVTTGALVNVQSVVLDTPLESLTNGQIICVQVGTLLENTGSLTLNVDSLGAVQVTDANGAACIGGEFQPAMPVVLCYTTSGPAWRIMSRNQRKGAWTPAFTLGAGTITTYNAQLGDYWIEGNTLHFNLAIAYTGAVGPGGALTVNMPITSYNLTNQAWSFPILPYNATTSLALSTVDVTFVGVLPPNSSTLTIVSFAESNGAIASAGGALATAGAVGIRINGSYTIAT
jgi:hypothetical protein